ncbi:hypothetical protein N624_2585 [Levilactobacillus brevis]|nr:hypothetical protein N624_2585 [Levilactobacillus brevis]
MAPPVRGIAAANSALVSPAQMVKIPPKIQAANVMFAE